MHIHEKIRANLTSYQLEESVMYADDNNVYLSLSLQLQMQGILMSLMLASPVSAELMGVRSCLCFVTVAKLCW